MGRALLVVPCLLVLGYAGLCALLYVQQRSLIYFPQATRIAADQTDFAIQRPDAVLRGWIVNPGQADAVVYYGGNAERVERQRDAWAASFPDATIYLVAYRGFGASDGEPREAPLSADAVAVFDAAARRHPDGHVSVIGRSLGSGVAAHVASQRRVRRLVLVTPFDSLTNVAQAHYPMFPVRWLMRERYDSAGRLSRHRGDLLVLRAGKDTVVPPDATDRLLAALPRTVRVVEFPDDGHDSLSDDPRYWAALRGFVAREAAP